MSLALKRTNDTSGADAAVVDASDDHDTAFNGAWNRVPGFGVDHHGFGSASADGFGHDATDATDTLAGFEPPVDHGDGTFTPGDLVDVEGLTNAAGDPVNVADVRVGDDGFGSAMLIFPNGETLTLADVDPAYAARPAVLQAMGIPAAPQGFVAQEDDGTDTPADASIADHGDDADMFYPPIRDGAACRETADGAEDASIAFAGTDVAAQDAAGIHTILPCLTPDSTVVTHQGDMRVDDLKVGDLVLTRDNGYQPIRWIGHRYLSAVDLAMQPDFAPVRIAKGALGSGLPRRDMMISPQLRLLLAGSRAEMLFGTDEVLVAAAHLCGNPGIDAVSPWKGVTYIHILFDAHQIIRVDGAWSESFQPAARSLRSMDVEQRDEVLALFPALLSGHTDYPAARKALKAHEVQILLTA